MLYKKNNTKELDTELFKNPTSEYRGTPFWAWNCELEKDMLLRQIEYLKQMGFGGFHMHSRSGMATEYLSDEFMDLVKACRDKAKEENMLAWLYDEDRWSSGSAGGYVTKTKAFRQKILVMSETPVEFTDKETGTREGLPYLLAVFDIVLDKDGKLASYKMISADDKAQGVKRYAYVKTSEESGWFNNQTYVDTLSEDAMRKFIEITYESYKKAVGDSFGDNVPAIFTDEPRFMDKIRLGYADSHDDAMFPWTTDFADTYKKTYGEDIIEKLPEVFWDLPNGKISAARYHYHDHICERFTKSFADQCGKWCEENNINLTGHMMAEASLMSQTVCIGEAMRAYRSFGIPGIDMLCNDVELTTAKQAQSAVHQFGREAMTSELYGVTNWDFDFRGHKFQGDWQAALGVTVRVPHLSWVSMKGSAKRDYPASINYQSPWYKEYPYVENHFARLNTVLTRGKPVVNVGVIHPIESCWIHYGPASTSSDVSGKLDDNFENVTNWLLTGLVDFDFISESLLPQQCGKISDKLNVGEMSYGTIIVPGCEMLRGTTLDILNKFKANGGRIIFIGECPKYVDAQESDSVKELYNASEHCGFDRIQLLDKLNNERTAKICNQYGETAREYVHALRSDGDVKWLFIARCVQDKETDDVRIDSDYTIEINGEYIPTLYDTVKGDIVSLVYEVKNGKTYIYRTLYPNDSLLIKLESGAGAAEKEKPDKEIVKVIDFKENVEYMREEDNVCVLDIAQYKLDDGEYCEAEEIIKLDDKCREILNYPKADGGDAQPWVLGRDIIEHYVTLRFELESELETAVCIAAEEAEYIMLNGREIELKPCGYYVDESIKKYNAGTLKKGSNIIEIKAPIGKRTSIENFFLLGDFDVEVKGCVKRILPPSKKIGFSNIVSQGMPFYGGNLIYKTEIETPECSLMIRTNRYRGAAIKVFVDGVDMGIIAYKPYLLNIDNVSAGKHTIEFKLFGNRVNTFGALHNCDYSTWFGPTKWYGYYNSTNSWTIVENNELYSTRWSYDYILKETGIISSPVICIKK